MTQPIDDRGGPRPTGVPPSASGPQPPTVPPAPPKPVVSADEVREVVEEGRRRFVATFPSRFEVLTVLIESAGGGDGDALLELAQTAHRLVGRAGATQFIKVAQHASALEALAVLPPGAAFDEPAASRLLGEIWSAFNEERANVGAAAAPAATPVASVSTSATNHHSTIQNQEDAPPCSTCGSIMIRSGACYKCSNCGNTSGCA